MTDSFLKNLSNLLIESENLFGTRDTCFIALKSLGESIESFQGSREMLHRELQKMVELVKNTSPRIALLIFMVFQLVENFEVARLKLKTLEEDKDFLIKDIIVIQEKRKKSMEKLLNASLEVVQDGDVILLHDNSHTVFDVLQKAKSLGKKFEVIVAEQENCKTMEVVRFLMEKHIPFVVVSEYMLTHTKDSITKVFLGAVTVNSLLEVIADAGSESIVSQMHLAGIPIYVPMTTDKLSLWQAGSKHHVLKTVKSKCTSGIDYEKLVFSHDRFPIALVTKFITNKGLLDPEAFKALYEEYYKNRSPWREKNAV